jgi:hypothetical protein
MRLCCPPGHGCNAAKGEEPCVLELCRRAAREEPAAALAVARWEASQALAAGVGKGERRFRRRAYERARHDALVVLLMRAHARAASSRGRRTARAGAASPPHGYERSLARLRVLLAHQGARPRS